MRIVETATILLGVASILLIGGGAAYVAGASGPDSPAAAAFVKIAPAGYRDWRFVSLAREEGQLQDLRVILGNDVAIRAYREQRLPFPDGTVIARLAYGYEESQENNDVFHRRQSFVAGAPKNGVQFMVKDSAKYAATGGWGYGHFDEGKPADDAMMQTCHPCHQAVQGRDFVFTRYAP